MKINVNSEIGKLNGVIIHTPGNEIQNMTPANAERALYSDILNLHVASEEYSAFLDVLRKFTNVYEVKTLLEEVLTNYQIKNNLINRICTRERANEFIDSLINSSPQEITTVLLEGLPAKTNTLTKFISNERFALPPLHNFFFTRDSAVVIKDNVLISKMANEVREREALIMDAIFRFHDGFDAMPINPILKPNFDDRITIEGGDILVIKDNLFIVGMGSRTSPEGIDFIIHNLAKTIPCFNIIVQELPKEPESFIHLDMAFTMLDVDSAMVYEPLIIKPNRYQTVLIEVDNSQVSSIKYVPNILKALEGLNIHLEPSICGGNRDVWNQEREQWHSGTNFFALKPGLIMGYARNINTLEELNNNGFEIISSDDIINDTIDINKLKKAVITVRGSELARGGGGCRCMTMPIERDLVSF